MEMNSKQAVRRLLRDRLEAITPADRQARSTLACAWVAAMPEFDQAQIVMLYLSTPEEVDTAPLALRCWRAGKTVVVPKVSWEQRRMLPTEITSLTSGVVRTAGTGIAEPVGGKPVPVDMIDLVIVPGLGFSTTGSRIGRGMGFYDRFLGQSDFIGRSCGLGFEEQVLDDLPMLDHDVPLSMLVTERGVRRFTPSSIQQAGPDRAV
jgi:5-formyltetrahydrofolate cyclo-ligase